MKVCIRTCDRPALLKRLLDSIMEWEPWLLEHPIEVSDGSHDPELRTSNEIVVTEFGRSTAPNPIDITIFNIFDLPHAAHAMEFFGCDTTELRGAFNVWQIYNRHKGQEIVLLDDDCFFPLARLAGGINHEPVFSENWKADAYLFYGGPGAKTPLNVCFKNGLQHEIRLAYAAGCNTLQLSTRGHGTCDDYSWLDVVPDLIRGDPATSTEIYYHLATPRILRMGFFTPTWIGAVPEVPILPPATRSDDTVAALVSKFGQCLWSPMTINHLRPEPKPFDRRMVSDAELVNLTLMLHGHKAEIGYHAIETVERALWSAKLSNGKQFPERPDDKTMGVMCDWINKVALKKPADRPMFHYEEPQEECE